MISLAFSAVVAVIFACVFTFQDARDKRVNTGVLITFFLIASAFLVINALESHTLEYLGTFILSLVIIFIGGIFDKRGWMGEADFDYFGIMLLLFPPWVSILNLPFVWWILLGTMLSLCAGSVVSFLIDKALGVKGESRIFSLGPFLLSGLLWAFVMAAVG